MYIGRLALVVSPPRTEATCLSRAQMQLLLTSTPTGNYCLPKTSVVGHRQPFELDWLICFHKRRTRSHPATDKPMTNQNLPQLKNDKQCHEWANEIARIASKQSIVCTHFDNTCSYKHWSKWIKISVNFVQCRYIWVYKFGHFGS